MRFALVRSVFVLLLSSVPMMVIADNVMIENFEVRPETRWRFFTDGVMGGISSGQVTFVQGDGQTFARMTGQVSTKNNGGFIQMRAELPDGASADTTGVRLLVRGNDQKYFVHLRTNGTVLPWQYYQASFDVTSAWSEVRLPLDEFIRSGRMLRATPRAESLKSIAVVAFGRDHQAAIDVRQVGFY